MNATAIAELLNEPACEHNNESKSGLCSAQTRDRPRAAVPLTVPRSPSFPLLTWPTSFMGRSRCAGSSWDNRGTPVLRANALSPRHDDRPDGAGRHHGPRRETSVSLHQASHRQLQAGRGLCLQHLCARPHRRRHRSRVQGGGPSTGACRWCRSTVPGFTAPRTWAIASAAMPWSST